MAFPYWGASFRLPFASEAGIYRIHRNLFEAYCRQSAVEFYYPSRGPSDVSIQLTCAFPGYPVRKVVL